MNTLIKILSLALLLSLAGNIWQHFHPRIIKPKAEIVYLPGEEKKVIVYDLPGGTQAATVKTSKEYERATKEAKELLKTVKSIPDLENEKRVTSLIAANMRLELKLSENQMILNDKEKQLKQWKDDHNSVSVNNSTNEVAVTSEISPKVVSSEKRPKFYKPKESYTTITSPNPSAKFYGLESYTFKNPKAKDVLEFNLKFQGLFINKEIIPYGGAELLINPDGKLKPIIGYGYFYDYGSGKLIPYWMGGLQLNLLRF